MRAWLRSEIDDAIAGGYIFYLYFSGQLGGYWY